ncbi:hypothetical protein GW846_02505 [Candidatus Gracilibacteria bacterium]|nr:hypothetical protein [Candidatus Gracilibacteria bacterium]
MSKEKDFFRELMRVFVSGSMYILMFIVAIFIFYKTLVLFFFVFAAIFVHMKEFNQLTFQGLSDTSTLGIRLAEQVLNIVTFILVLVKSFKILVEYSKNQHIAIKDLVEISIIALLMEVVFNFGIHDMSINILFALFGLALLIIYAAFPYFRESTHK